jgi:hypothetical protein
MFISKQSCAADFNKTVKITAFALEMPYLPGYNKLI